MSDPAEAPPDLEFRIDQELIRQRVRHEASKRLHNELTPPLPPLDVATAAEVLARPHSPRDRIVGLLPWDSSMLLVAQRKTGKTTMALNLARCLLTGDAFLEALPVRRVTGRVAILNYEVTAALLAEWAAEAGVPLDRLVLVNLRGVRSPLATDADADRLAAQLAALDVETVIVDPFGRAFAGTSQNDVTEVSAWLARLDRFKVGTGALDLILTAHAGWQAERTRGSSGLEDWADVILTMGRDEDAGVRYLRATGRAGDLDEDRLDFDPGTRRLSLAGSGGRRASREADKLAELANELVTIATAQPGLSGRQLDAIAQTPRQRGMHTKALRMAVEDGRLVVTPGARGAKLYSPTPTYPDPPRRDTSPPTPTSPYGTGVGDGTRESLTYPEPESLPDAPHECHADVEVHP